MMRKARISYICLINEKRVHKKGFNFEHQVDLLRVDGSVRGKFNCLE